MNITNAISEKTSPATGQPVFAITKDKDQNLFFSTENFLYKLNINSGSYFTLVSTKHNSDIDNLKSVYHIYFEDNIVWIGCQNGLAYFKNNPAEFNTFFNSSNSSTKIAHAYFLYPLNDSVIFSTAENGLYKVNMKTDQIEAVDESRVYDFIFTDPGKKIIVSNRNGLFILNNGALKSISDIYGEFKLYTDYRINSAIPINRECIAMGTENYKGVLVWNYVKHTVENFRKDSKEVKLEENVTNNIFFLKENMFCILGDNSFSEFNYAKKGIRTFQFQKKDSNGLCNLFFDMCSYKNEFYLASYGNGVLRLDKDLNLKQIISTQNGLSNNGVYKLLPWKDSLLFITTNSGLSIYNASNTSFKRYYESDGLHNDNFEETSGNSYNNTLFAGGAKGFTVIYPENIKPNDIPPLLYFNRVRIELPDGHQLDTSNLDAKFYNIPNNAIQSNIYFSGINYSNPERTSFAYRITEQSKSWINISTQNFVTLIGLSPGTYHLQVKAANEDGVWSQPKELTLIFEPKWYQTWWFYLLIAITVAGILYALYRYRIAQIKKQHEIRKNIATDLHDDLGSTLNSVKVFTNLAISGVKQEESLQQVKDNLTEATMSLRDMIWVLDDSLDTVDELITRLKQFAIPVAAASNIEAIIKADSEVNSRQLMKEEKRNLFLICKEAINNSIKYAAATQIQLNISPAGKKIQIIIADNGKGFDEAIVKKGYGLKNMQYRAGQIKYRINLSSSVGKGTTITITPGV